ncbi:MAG: Hpt domain-containing protein [SAR324 cluster bacterium]|nr:Hpt domain-containing protein [SAR324 cluster bacterium]
MKKIFVLIISLLMGVFWFSPAFAADEVKCDSCLFKIDNLDKPFPMHGTWLFTRDDRPENKNVVLDTTDWKVIKAPGPWKKAYKDGVNFRVGWYRAVLEFNPDLIGTEVTFLVGTYLGKFHAYLDGEEIYDREGQITLGRYYGVQPVPVRFTITQPRQVLTLRVNTILMTGIYQLPLEIRKYQMFDGSLALRHFMGGEFRMLASTVCLLFGLFFLLVYIKTRYPMYLSVFLITFGIYPFLINPTDIMTRIWNVETLLILHYWGMGAIFFMVLFAEYVTNYIYPRLNWVLGILALIVAGTFLFLGLVHFNLQIFQIFRTIIFILILTFILIIFYLLIKGIRNKIPHTGTMMVLMSIFLVSAVNDIMLALGLLPTISTIAFGILGAIFAILWVTSNIFADTFLENKRLVRDLKNINENLEKIVEERTEKLRQKTNDIASMLENLEEGILAIQADETIHPEYSHFLETIFETKEITGKNVMDLIFKESSVGINDLDQMETAISSSLGEDEMNFMFNQHLLVGEIEKVVNGKTKHLEFSWSPMSNDGTIEKILLCVRDMTELKKLQAEANQQKEELEIIGQILTVSATKFHTFLKNADKFIEENRKLISETNDKNKDVIATLFRNMHTIKGNARTYGLSYITDATHQVEHTYDQLRKDPDKVWNSEELLVELELAEKGIARYAEVFHEKLEGFAGSGDEGKMIDKSLISYLEKLELDMQQTFPKGATSIKRFRKAMDTQPLDGIVQEIVQNLPKLAAELQKEPPKVEIHDNGIRVVQDSIPMLRDVFMHMFRNSMDHGLETGNIRLGKGKEAQGNIWLTADMINDRLILKMGDDGQGLNLERLKNKAVETGLFTDVSTVSDMEAADLIFKSGLSTAEKVSEISGRGVGMDAVKRFLQGQGGDVSIILDNTKGSSTGRNFQLQISLPANLCVQIK